MENFAETPNFAEFWAKHPKLRGNCSSPQNFRTRKLGKIMVFCEVSTSGFCFNQEYIQH